LHLPIGGFPHDLRIAIADLADHESKRRKERDILPPLQAGSEINPLVGDMLIELVKTLEEVGVLVGALQTDDTKKRLINASRFTLLLARDFRAVAQQKIKVPLGPVKVAPLFESILALLEDLLSDCEVACDVAKGTPPILADELSVLQILVNLINNAVEAMQSEASETSQVRLTLKAQSCAGGVQITVGDTGCGIEPERISRIFGLSYSTKRGHERGVGLHIVSSLVRQLNGRIDVKSVVGSGTVFTILLPAAHTLASTWRNMCQRLR
jgi:signal transduction histidine kinase